MPKSIVQPPAKNGDPRCKYCGRRALWRVGQLFMCNPDYEAWVMRHDFDPFSVERLSDDERDFDRLNIREPLLYERA